ncbi:MAG: hypothetical protein COA77_07405 [Thaumarchaeota archaeon]|nr:MAG: hypothetical protein COA77_07405 [Nitrososphaerota archaeon]
MEKLRTLVIKMQVLWDYRFDILVDYDPLKDSPRVFSMHSQTLEVIKGKVKDETHLKELQGITDYQ